MRKKFDFIWAGIDFIITYLFLSQTNKYINGIISSLRTNITNPPKLSALFLGLHTKIMLVFAFGVLYVCSITVFTYFYHKHFRSK